MSLARRLAVSAAAAIAAAVLVAPTAGALTLPSGFDSQPLVGSLSRPTAIAFTPDGRMLIASKDGTVQAFTPGGGLTGPIIDLRAQVDTAGDRGLLGIAVDSDYVHNHFVYLLYTHLSNPADVTGPQTSQLLRVVLDQNNHADAGTPILGSVSTDPCPAPSNTLDCIPSDGLSHSIGTVRADPDGTLWLGSGDAADYNTVDPLALRSYNETTFAGKIIHIDRDGRGLPGHPFCRSDANLDHVCTKLYAKGFRNPFRFTLRSGGLGPAVGDVGWYSWEELDLTQPGRDYGWPCWEGNGHTPGYDQLSGCTDPGGQYHAGAQLPDFTFAHSDGGVAVVGGPTYTGTDFPTGYRGTVFFGDYGSGIVRRWDPNAQAATPFASDTQAWVDLEPAPASLSYAHAGDLLYVSIGDFSDGTGSVGRVFYTTGNRLPVARASGTPTAGGPPLTVSFTGGWSSDPDGDPITYDWDFGDGSDHSTQANPPPHTYTSRGRYIARLTVSDGRGLTGTATVTVTVGGPVVTIANPASGSRYRDGAAVPLQGSAIDAGDQAIPDSGLSWHVILHHSTSHIHDVGMFPGGSASFVAQVDHDADSWYDVTLTATDSDGLTGSQTVSIYPQSVHLSLASSPAGAPVSYGGINATTPFGQASAVGYQTTISAAQQFTGADGASYVFGSWSDGGARLHDITIPSSDTTLTALYDRVPTVVDSGSGSAGAIAGSGPLGGTLIDRRGPVLRLSASAAGLSRGRLRGTVRDPSGIRLVEVAVRARHVGGTPCRWWSPSRRALTRPRACSPPAWIRARVSGISWSASVGHGLPRGSYVVLVRAVDRRGNATTAVTTAARR